MHGRGDALGHELGIAGSYRTAMWAWARNLPERYVQFQGSSRREDRRYEHRGTRLRFPLDAGPIVVEPGTGCPLPAAA